MGRITPLEGPPWVTVEKFPRGCPTGAWLSATSRNPFLLCDGYTNRSLLRFDGSKWMPLVKELGIGCTTARCTSAKAADLASQRATAQRGRLTPDGRSS